MLSPETWNFKPPAHHSSVTSGSVDISSKIISEISKHYFNHSVTIVLPDTVLVPKDLNTALTTDSVYYKVDQLSIYRFLDKPFINSFVKSGRLWALSVDTHVDTDDCAAVTPCGHLILSLLKETYQTLGLQGTPSKFSSERYVVTIDLKQESFTPGKKNYERALRCLSQFVDLQMDFLIAWEPPGFSTDVMSDEELQKERLVCPSSIAAYFSGLSYEVSSCTPQVFSSRQYDVPLPSPSTTDHPELLDWLGAVALGVDMKRDDSESCYLSSYMGPLESSRESQVAVLKYFGFFTTTQVEKLFRILSAYVKRRNDLPLAALHVQGFADSPVSWGLQEHTFHCNGDNHYTLVLQSGDSSLLCKTTAFPFKIKHKIG